MRRFTGNRFAEAVFACEATLPAPFRELLLSGKSSREIFFQLPDILTEAALEEVCDAILRAMLRRPEVWIALNQQAPNPRFTGGAA
jgi:hypothetical protein